MQRASVFLLVVGAALLVTWLVSPASSAPGARTGRADPPAAPVSSALSALDASSAALGARALAPPAVYEPPIRDPFSFSTPARRETTRATTTTPVVASPSSPLPTLVAILGASSHSSGAATAVLSNGDDVQFVRQGDVVGAFVVKSVTTTGVVITDRVRGTDFALELQ